MGEACHSFTGPPHTRGRARMEAAQQTTTTPQAHPQEPQWDTRYGVATQVTRRVVVTTPLMVTPSLVSELKPPPLLGTLIGTHRWRGTLVMGLIRLSMLWMDDFAHVQTEMQASIDSHTSLMHDLFGYFRINPDT
jgi:hypothetical protein